MSAAVVTNPPAAPAWAPYRDADSAWGARQVVHLYRRAAFGATWEEVERGVREGPEWALDRLLSGRMDGRPAEDFERTAQALAESAVSSGQPGRLKAWWVYRMLHSPDPLGEQMTLMWHNHFATSNLKVDDPRLMWRQNETFRRLARAPFGELLRAVLRDPALLVWLDAPSNRSGAPNENLARELMELFTLGVGHYAEADVKETARVLTGWSVEEGEWRQRRDWHDGGIKTVLGKTGRWGGDALAEILLDHPATARRLVWRVCDHFLGPGVAAEAELAALAEELRRRDLDIGWAAQTVLRSARFFSEAEKESRVLPPIDFVLGALRALEQTDPAPSPAVLADWAAQLGQELFYPPNVGGWPGGRTWLSPQTMIGRVQFAAELAEGRLWQPHRPLDVAALAARHGFGPEPKRVLEFLCHLLMARPLPPEWRAAVLSGLDDSAAGHRRLLARVLASPSAQLG